MTILEKIKTLNLIKEAHRELGNDNDVKNINESIASISIMDVLTDKWEIDMFVISDESGGVVPVENKKPNIIVDCNHD